jgi:hypothetical protein
MAEYQEVRTTEHEQGREQRVATFKVTQVIWLLLGLLEAAIGLRVVFKLIAVNEANPFAVFLNNVTNIFVAPFATLAGSPAYGGMVLEISSILAMIVYLLIAWGLERIVNVLFYRPRGPVSVRQTTVAEHSALQTPTVITQPNVRTPITTANTTVTEHVETKTSGPV